MYTDYEFLTFDRADDGVLLVTLNRPERMNATNERLHFELSRVFYDIDVDAETSVVVVTGAGSDFCAGGDLEMVERMLDDRDLLARQVHEVLNLVNGMVNCSKVIVSAIEGNAVGAGLSVGLLADLSVAASDARLNDGHLRLGVAAGDHAALLWPMLCGLARAKHLVLTGQTVTGAQAAELGLVSLAVPPGAALREARLIASRLATQAPLALSWTKRSMNGWLRMAAPIFEQSLMSEMLSFGYPPARAGVDRVARRRPT